MTIPFKPLFSYPKLVREESEGKRLYLCPDGNKVPSVTTILSATKDGTFLEEWRERVGDKAADLKIKTSCEIGTLLHAYLEKFLLGDVTGENNRSNLIHKIVQRMSKVVIDEGFSKLSSYHGTEISLYYPGLYAGTADLIATYEGSLAILDYKNSEKIKKEEWIEGYYIQGTAYAMAHNELFGTNINKIVILMVTRPKLENPNEPIEFHDFVLEGNKYKEYEDKWLARLEQFYSLS